MFKKTLTNDLTWSVSRDRLFRTCQRAYYYSYYGSWGGWEPESPARQLYILKNIRTFPLWAGTIVHDIIRNVLTKFRSDRIPFESDALQQYARHLLREGWVQSVKKAWLQYPKKAVNLFEHYYGDGTNQVPAEQTEALKEKVYDALANFCQCDTLQELLTLPDPNWKSIDTLDKFIAGDLETDTGTPYPLPVWCAIDLAYVDQDQKLHIVDWKTGAEHKDELVNQLSVYARYAMGKWGFSLDNIVLEGVFLNDGGLRKRYTVTESSLTHTADFILNSGKAMRAKLTDPINNTADEENFPCTSNPNNCVNCPFREKCHG